jgi:hypothetical protein
MGGMLLELNKNIHSERAMFQKNNSIAIVKIIPYIARLEHQGKAQCGKRTLHDPNR